MEARNDVPEILIIGRKYHCAWAKNRGFVWILKSVENGVATLETPKTRKIIKSSAASLREINKNIKS